MGVIARIFTGVIDRVFRSTNEPVEQPKLTEVPQFAQWAEIIKQTGSPA